MRRVIPLICVCLLLTIAVPAFAQQQRLFAVMPNEVVELDPRSESLGAVLRRFPVPADARPGGANDAVAFGGGEFLVWTGLAASATEPGPIVLLNTHSGAVQQFTFPGFIPSGVMGTDGNARLLVGGGPDLFTRNVVLVADARSGSARFLNLGGTAASPPRGFAYAAASDVLFVGRPGDFVIGQQSPRLVDVIHASTGALLKTLDISPHLQPRLSTNAAGTRLFLTGESGAFAFDVASGALLASNTFDQVLQGIPGSTITLEEHRNRFVATVTPRTSGYEDFAGFHAFSADSLQFIGKMPVPELPLPPRVDPDDWPSLRQRTDISAQSATVFVLQAVAVAHEDYAITTTCHESQLIALDAEMGKVRQMVSTTAALGSGACLADLVRITEPAPPSAPTAAVDGHRVTLQWPVSLDTTQYQVEAGSASGLANLATIDVTNPQLVVDGVPSGVYYLRVRAINSIGKSGASQEVQLVVP